MTSIFALYTTIVIIGQNYTAQHLHVHMYYIIHVHNQHLHNKVNLNQKANKQNQTYMS